jgi:hypothetical protein
VKRQTFRGKLKKRQKLAGSRQSFAARSADCFVMTFGRSTKWDGLRRSRFLDRRHAQTRAKVFGLLQPKIVLLEEIGAGRHLNQALRTTPPKELNLKGFS